MKQILLLSTCLLLAFLLVGQAPKGKDYGIFFAIENYQTPFEPLNMPIKEAEEIAKVLKDKYAFQVKIYKNLNVSAIYQCIDSLRKCSFGENGQLLLFFSGHGEFDEVAKIGYFIPANAKGKYEYIAYPSFRREIDAIPCKHTLLMIDACYAGTFDDEVGFKDRPDTWQNQEASARIAKLLSEKTRYFASSAAKKRSPEKSQFAKGFVAALNNPPADGIITLTDLQKQWETANPKPYTNGFGSHEGGNFVFLSTQKIAPPPPPIDEKQVSYNKMKPDCDAEFQAENWAAAKWCYSFLLKYQPNDKYATQQIATCETKLNALQGADIESKYQQSLSSARYYKNLASAAEKAQDCLSEKANWELAKPFYQQCLDHKPNDATGKEGVKLCTDELKALDCDPDKDGFEGKADKCPDKAGVAPDGCPKTTDIPVPEMVYVEGNSNISSFYMGKYEITKGQFASFIAETSYQTDADKEGWSYVWRGSTWEKKNGVNWRNNISGTGSQPNDHPVIHVSWNDAKAYCAWLSKKTGDNYGLPQEAQWEYAADGGKNISGYDEYAGSSKIDEVAWYSSNSVINTHAVGGKKANALGLYDMSGNVWEWCEDIYIGSDRAYRGGSWDSYASDCRVAFRLGNSPDFRNLGLGFRLSRAL